LLVADITNGYVDVTTSTLSNGTTYNIRAAVTDKAGNQSALSTSGTRDITVDTIAPTAAVAITAISTDTGISTDFITSDTTLTVSGTNGALGTGERIEISSNNGSTWNTVSVSGTTWSYNDTGTTHNADVTYQVRVIDLADNVGNTDSQLVDIDTTTPRAAVAITAISTDTGAADYTTSDTTLMVFGSNGTLGTGEKVQISTNGTSWNDVTAVTSSTWSYDDTGTTRTANVTYQVRVVDLADNVGNTASQLVTRVSADTTPPTVIVNIVSSVINTGGSSTTRRSNVTFTFSEEPTGFTLSDITQEGGSVDNFAVSDSDPKIYTARFTANKDFIGTGRVSVTASSYTDLSGNAGAAGTDTVTLGTAVTAAPIALDLNSDGISYLSQEAGITFDYNNDGIAEATAWVAPEDGLLAQLKSDSTHNIVFSTQAGETDLQGLAKVYDSNKDGVFDSSDTAFAEFGVWQDADSDGVVDSGEFLSLADRGITSLSLTSDGQIRFEANGDVIVYGQTTYTTSDGQLHIAEDVGFAVSDVEQPLDIAAIIANADALEAVRHIDQLADTPSSSSLMVELGGQTYEIATLPGQEVGSEDMLSQFAGSQVNASLLGDRSWTEVIDIESDHGGPGSILTAGGTLNDSSYANNEGDWTVIINSGDAQVDSANNQITFASESAGNSVTIITADGASHDINNVDKIQWHG
jgi:hypothetical protein